MLPVAAFLVKAQYVHAPLKSVDWAACEMLSTLLPSLPQLKYTVLSPQGTRILSVVIPFASVASMMAQFLGSASPPYAQKLRVISLPLGRLAGSRSIYCVFPYRLRQAPSVSSGRI